MDRDLNCQAAGFPLFFPEFAVIENFDNYDHADLAQRENTEGLPTQHQRMSNARF